MNLNTESVPTAWTSVDESFFLIAHDLFAPDFLAGASVLLISYDSDVPSGSESAEQAGTAAAPAVAPARATA